MEYLRRVDPDAYAHVWLGECRISSDAQILHGKWAIGEMEVPPNALGPFWGNDLGFSSDPTTLVKCWIIGASKTSQGTLYVEYDFGMVGLETRDMARAFRAAIPGLDRHVFYSDCSRPETISHLVHDGLNSVACDKWSGSVEDGIAYLRSFEQIVIHPRCKGVEQEARLYSFKVDKLTGMVTTDIVQKHDHYIDAIRYALCKLIKRSGPGAGFLNFIANQAAEQAEKAQT